MISFSYFSCNNISSEISFFNQNQGMPSLSTKEHLHPNSILTLGRCFLFRILQGDELLLFVIGESFVASNHFIRVIIILIMLITLTSIFAILKIVYLHNLGSKYNQIYRSLKLAISESRKHFNFIHIRYPNLITNKRHILFNILLGTLS